MFPLGRCVVAESLLLSKVNHVAFAVHSIEKRYIKLSGFSSKLAFLQNLLASQNRNNLEFHFFLLKNGKCLYSRQFQSLSQCVTFPIDLLKKNNEGRLAFCSTIELNQYHMTNFDPTEHLSPREILRRTFTERKFDFTMYTPTFPFSLSVKKPHKHF